MKGGLVLAHLAVGRLIRVGGVPYRIVKNPATGPSVFLVALDGTEQEVEMARAVLQSNISDATAVLFDPIARRAVADDMPPVTLGLLSRPTVLQWYERMILLRGLMPFAAHSPRSATYQRAYEDALRLFDWSRSNREVRYPSLLSVTRLSAKRANDLLREWRQHGGALAALMVQISPARRARPVSALAAEIRNAVQKTAKKLPNASTATVHRVAGAAFRSRKKKQHKS